MAQGAQSCREQAPVATYRLQLGPSLDFTATAALVPYLKALGVSHVYLSPILQAAAGSSHGYDVIDHSAVSAELGGEEGYFTLSRVLDAHGMKQLVDIVPNHMSVADPRNAWWWDVLTHGRASRHAAAFDVDWCTAAGDDRDVVLVPVLADHRGLVLDRREIELRRTGASITCFYMGHTVPISPESLGALLRSAGARLACAPPPGGETDESRCSDVGILAFLADRLSTLPQNDEHAPEDQGRRARDHDALRGILADVLAQRPHIAAQLDAELQALNQDPDALDAFLCTQHHRLAFWRMAAHELDYRRFFDVNSLVGLRMEEPHVFEASHALIARLVREGVVHGLRVDHVDGLADPLGYLERLRAMAPQAWIVVEKILTRSETLRDAWPVDGTTGYDFLNDVLGLFVDPRATEMLDALWRDTSGQHHGFLAVARQARLQVLADTLASEVERTVRALAEVCARSRLHRDYTRAALHHAVTALAAAFPTYRTYVRPRAHGAPWEVHADDGAAVSAAVDAAVDTVLGSSLELDPRLVLFVRDILLGGVRTEHAARFVQRFQQLTGPVAAKGVEDTAHYRHTRFLALNEVGGEPARPPPSLEVFHGRNAAAAQRMPLRMNTTSTHDTKRSEDVRARLAVLSEDPAWWARSVARLREHARRHRRGAIPDGAFELWLYQTLVGAWPLSHERLEQAVLKAAREAKTHTSWMRIDPRHERALLEFVHDFVEDPAARAELEAAVARVRIPGYRCALAQVLLKLVSPGVPDIYQGTELWAFDLVDPDNRRAVDWPLRHRQLSRVMHMDIDEIMAGLEEGLPKLALIHRGLALRAQHPELFDARGSYAPLEVRGRHRHNAVAIARGGELVAVTPRLVFLRDPATLEAHIVLPQGRWFDVMTREFHAGGETALAHLVRRFPVGLLHRSAR